ncbi:MAG: DUF2269 family protein [Pseudomonadota bacterium]
MQRTRKVVKVLHTVAASGLIGGLGCYMLLLVISTPTEPAAYADLRQSITIISDYVLLPSLALALVTGLFSMVVHTPFQDKGWVWIKAVSGVLMFKGVLTIVSAKADYAAKVSIEIANGEAAPDALQSLLTLEWYTLLAVLAISIANVILGVWRPRVIRLSSPDTLRAANKPVAAE